MMLNKSNKKEEPSLTYWQKRDLEKAAEAKKRRNIFMSKRSGEEGGTGYQASSSAFAGGVVQSRSRVSNVGGEVRKSAFESVRSKSGFAQATRGRSNTGFAKGVSRAAPSGGSGAKPPIRPLGL